jgi:hypothetical protein
MTSRSFFMAGASVLVLAGALASTAFADDSDGTRVRYDSQAGQTRDLNNASLERARAENDGGYTSDGNDDDGPSVVPTDDRDPQGDDDDDDDDDNNDTSPKSGNDGTSRN